MWGGGLLAVLMFYLVKFLLDFEDILCWKIYAKRCRQSLTLFLSIKCNPSFT
jgi:hypothetical protein